jgi:hypothetical protein
MRCLLALLAFLLIACASSSSQQAKPATPVKGAPEPGWSRQPTPKEKLRQFCRNLRLKPSKPGQMRMWCGTDIDRATCCVDQSPGQLRQSPDK